MWRRWNENCKGYRFYKVAIDKNINDEIFDLFSTSLLCKLLLFYGNYLTSKIYI